MPAETNDAPDPARAIIIVTGATLRAETADRPLAYRLRERILRRLDDHHSPRAGALRVIVCSDLWFVSDDALHDVWAIAVGPPDDNALTALVEANAPVAFAIEGVLTVRMDLDFRQRQLACWGADALQTVNAIDAFAERYLDLLLDRILAPPG